MRLKNANAIITGASRGIGRFIAKAMAKEGVNLVLAARSAAGLESVAEEIRGASDVQVAVVQTDVSQTAQLDHLLTTAEAALGPIDVLINNAALERIEVFWSTDFEHIEMDLAVNVRAPMYLSQRILPGMLERNRGHIVNIASLAGLGGYPHGESYVATKHALVGFSRGLRASLQSTGRAVSASAVCPGYVSDVGMFARKQDENQAKPPRIMGTSSPHKVAQAVVRAIRKNQAEVVVNSTPVRPFLAMFALAPRLGEWLSRRLGINTVSEGVIGHEQSNDREA